MAEIYKNTNDPIRTKVFWKGELVTSTSVTAVVFDITEDVTIIPNINPNNQIGVFPATEDEVNPGTYYINLPLNLTTRNKNLRIVWYFLVGSQTESLVTFCDIVTPYVSIAEAIEDLNLGADQSDPMYKTYHEIRMAEKYARKQVEYFTGQKFSLYDEEFTIMGNDSDTLPLPSKIYSLHSLSQNDQLWVDNLNNINNIGYVIEPTTSGFGIKINQASLIQGDTYIANGMIPPSINDISPNIFRRGKHYDVHARFGWEYVPDEVEQATIEIMRSYFAKDRSWRDRYVSKISTTDWDFQFTSDAFSGTGSAYADKLLLDYVVTQMVVV